MPFLDAGTISTPPNISDHKATYIRCPFHYLCQSTYKRLVWIYKRADFNKLKELIISFEWNVLLEGSLNDACIKFTDTFLDFARSCIPSKTVTIRPNDKPWFDSVIRKNMCIRDRLKKKSIQSRSTNDWNKYKQARNKVNNLIKHANEKFYNNLEISISDFYNNGYGMKASYLN